MKLDPNEVRAAALYLSGASTNNPTLGRTEANAAIRSMVNQHGGPSRTVADALTDYSQFPATATIRMAVAVEAVNTLFPHGEQPYTWSPESAQGSTAIYA